MAFVSLTLIQVCEPHGNHRSSPALFWPGFLWHGQEMHSSFPEKGGGAAATLKHLIWHRANTRSIRPDLILSSHCETYINLVIGA